MHNIFQKMKSWNTSQEDFDMVSTERKNPNINTAIFSQSGWNFPKSSTEVVNSYLNL